MQNMNKKMLKIVYGDCTLGVSGDNFSYIFSYVAGGMESLVKDGIEWLFRCPKPAFWRALTDNDRGCGFQVQSGAWMSADMFIHCVKKQVIVDDKDIGLPCAPYNNAFSANEYADHVKIIFTYETVAEACSNDSWICGFEFWFYISWSLIRRTGRNDAEL